MFILTSELVMWNLMSLRVQVVIVEVRYCAVNSVVRVGGEKLN